MNPCSLNKDGIIVPGSNFGSDITIPMAVLKKKLKNLLLNTQQLDSLYFKVVGESCRREGHGIRELYGSEVSVLCIDYEKERKRMRDADIGN